ncbi:substrate-binding domain-containing protein, partial [Alicyclobacillus sp.]|uniref:substrate-binding domain-containing protein n=1 Tax=Alicyclobacillus sp. TaxID=61169 RepID=UPI0025BB0318
LLRDWVRETGAPVRVLEVPMGSGEAVRGLAEGIVHVAGVHGRRFASMAGVRENVRRLGDMTDPGARLVRVHFARWEIGVAVRSGNPRGVRGLEDLGRQDLRWVRRPANTAIASVYEAVLEGGIDRVRWTPVAAADHLQAAEMIAVGLADAGLTTAFAAHQHELDFQPVEDHRFDWILPIRRLSDPAVANLMDTLRTGAFRRQLETLWGYDAAGLGDIMEVEGSAWDGDG